eukprot:TRINITY_DN19456_c0_g1_i2.p1 TRINITY_DN19456_c0_g1~~TRINITY_DN19456_c0_g1_i2.p1  ORF type:complete len:332 (+),score=37.24 TRINITY_DN19456_c0_g1_i2:54-998(+)
MAPRELGAAETPLTLPPELAAHVFGLLPPLHFLSAAVATCRQFSFRWYITSVFPCSITVPDEEASLNQAINKLGKFGCHAGAKGLVLIRPGTYRESVRITQNCHLLGMGPHGSIIVEAPGWESALVSSGLGGAAVPKFLRMENLTTGEDSCIENLTFRCRNEHMRGRCVYIVMGSLHLLRCSVEGGVKISGHCTQPRLTECRVRSARGCGLHLTDHCKASLHRNHVGRNGRHGVLIDRHALPEISQNHFVRNGACGIRLYSGAVCHADTVAQSKLASQRRVCARDNCFEDNPEGELSISPGYADSEAESDELEG